MKKDPKVRPLIVIDEDQETLELIAEPLRWEGYEVHTFSTIAKASEAVLNIRPQLVLIDPDFSLQPIEETYSFINSMTQGDHFTPVIVVSSQPTTEKITLYLDLGASDFVSSPFVHVELLARVRTQLRLRDMKEELIQANQKLQELIEIDDLTGLFNMRSLFSKLEFEIERAQRFQRPVTVVMIDMDKFKSVNDGHDHLFGSYILSEVGKIIRQNTRTVDIPARYGGDEFLIVVSEISQSGVEYFCEKLRAKVEETLFKQGPDQIKLTLSIGFATFEGSKSETISAKELVRRADAALYAAKDQGRNRVVGYTQDIDRLRKFEKSSVSQIFEFKNKDLKKVG